MKKFNFILVTLLLFAGYAFPQDPVFDNSISINQNFTTDTEIYPFNGELLYGVGVNGNITFNSDSSLVRIILKDSLSIEYMIYESYPMLDTIWTFTFNEECEETCFLDEYIATSFIIQIIDASIYLDEIKWSGSPSENITELQMQAKTASDLEKIDKLNAFINSKGMLWTAEGNSYAKYFYYDKRKILGNKYNSRGFEYYSGGIFEIFIDNYIYDPTYDIIDHFDWREKP